MITRDRESTKALERILGVECRCPFNATCSLHDEAELVALLQRRAEEKEQQRVLAFKCATCERANEPG